MKVDFVLRVLIVLVLSCSVLVMRPSYDRVEAAVRVCKAHVTSKLISADSEIEAKREAIKDWTEKAKASGLGHPSWRIAGYKVLKCIPRAGRFECVAHGAPCTIKQKAPPKRKERIPNSTETGIRNI